MNVGLVWLLIAWTQIYMHNYGWFYWKILFQAKVRTGPTMPQEKIINYPAGTDFVRSGPVSRLCVHISKYLVQFLRYGASLYWGYYIKTTGISSLSRFNRY